MFSNPIKNVEQLGLTPGMRVADFGAGSGFYSIESAKAVGDAGRVFAIDIQQDLLVRLKNQAKGLRIHNIETVWGDVEKVGGTRLREGIIDVAIVANILFQIQHKEQVAREIWRILKPQGRVCVIDWTDSFGGLGPHQNEIVTESAARAVFEKEGFHFVRDIPAGDHHYGIILAKK